MHHFFRILIHSQVYKKVLCFASRAMLVSMAILFVGLSIAQTAPPATTTSSGTEIKELHFADFFRMPVGSKGLEISDTLQKTNGQLVRIVGYLVQQESPVPGRFMFTARPVQMSEHADGEADDLPPATVMVYLDAKHKDWVVPHVRGLVSLQGVLNVGRAQEPDGRVSWVQLQLSPQATRDMNAMDLAIFKHQLQHRH
jgi:hypothetical protein